MWREISTNQKIKWEPGGRLAAPWFSEQLWIIGWIGGGGGTKNKGEYKIRPYSITHVCKDGRSFCLFRLCLITNNQYVYGVTATRTFRGRTLASSRSI